MAHLDGEEILRTSHGRRSGDTVSRFLLPEQCAQAVAEIEQMELADMDEVAALPGTRDLLLSLPQDRWAAVTSGSRRLMCARLAAAGLPAPRVLVTSEDVGVGKPDPEGYREAAAALGCDVTRCLVIEDAPAGIGAGRASGAAVLAVATSHDAAQLTEADAVVSALTGCSVTAMNDGLLVTVYDGSAGSDPAGKAH